MHEIEGIGASLSAVNTRPCMCWPWRPAQSIITTLNHLSVNNTTAKYYSHVDTVILNDIQQSPWADGASEKYREGERLHR